MWNSTWMATAPPRSPTTRSAKTPRESSHSSEQELVFRYSFRRICSFLLNTSLKLFTIGDISPSGGATQRLAQETQATASLSHPNIAKIFEFSEFDDPDTAALKPASIGTMSSAMINHMAVVLRSDYYHRITPLSQMPGNLPAVRHRHFHCISPPPSLL